MHEDIPTKEEVLDAMEKFGGGFVSNLAKAWRRADFTNNTKLMDTFGDYYSAYEGVAKHIKQERSKP